MNASNPFMSQQLRAALNRESADSKDRFASPYLAPDFLSAHLSAIIEKSNDGIFSTDLEGRLLSWNPAAERIYGYSAEEMLGRDISIVLPIRQENEIRSIIQRVLNREEISSFETTRKRKDGKLIHVYLTVSPVCDEEGKIIGVSTVARDVTAKKLTEVALARKQQELEDFFENAVVGLHWVGADGRILWANRAEMESLGYDRGEYIGRHISDFHADPPVIWDILQRLRRNEKLHGYEARLRCKDGSLKHVLISSSVLWDNGRFVHTRCVTVDVTERKIAEEALRRTEKMAATGRLAASIAHEINNPLAAVANLLYLVKTNPSSSENPRYLELADHELKRVAHIAKRTLGFFRDTSECKRILLDDLADDVIAIYHSRIEGRGIRIVRDFRGATIHGSEGELRQVMSNLLLNALDASPHRSTIKIRIRVVGERAILTVADSGSGIDAADRDKIFEPFFTTKTNTGTGLGLWVSRQIVTNHQGTLRFRSPSGQDKMGTVFRMTLPAAA